MDNTAVIEPAVIEPTDPAVTADSYMRPMVRSEKPIVRSEKTIAVEKLTEAKTKLNYTNEEAIAEYKKDPSKFNFTDDSSMKSLVKELHDRVILNEYNSHKELYSGESTKATDIVDNITKRNQGLDKDIALAKLGIPNTTSDRLDDFMISTATMWEKGKRTIQDVDYLVTLIATKGASGLEQVQDYFSRESDEDKRSTKFFMDLVKAKNAREYEKLDEASKVQLKLLGKALNDSSFFSVATATEVVVTLPVVAQSLVKDILLNTALGYVLSRGEDSTVSDGIIGGAVGGTVAGTIGTVMGTLSHFYSGGDYTNFVDKFIANNSIDEATSKKILSDYYKVIQPSGDINKDMYAAIMYSGGTNKNMLNTTTDAIIKARKGDKATKGLSKLFDTREKVISEAVEALSGASTDSFPVLANKLGKFYTKVSKKYTAMVDDMALSNNIVFTNSSSQAKLDLVTVGDTEAVIKRKLTDKRLAIKQAKLDTVKAKGTLNSAPAIGAIGAIGALEDLIKGYTDDIAQLTIDLTKKSLDIADNKKLIKEATIIETANSLLKIDELDPFTKHLGVKVKNILSKDTLNTYDIAMAIREINELTRKTTSPALTNSLGKTKALLEERLKKAVPDKFDYYKAMNATYRQMSIVKHSAIGKSLGKLNKHLIAERKGTILGDKEGMTLETFLGDFSTMMANKDSIDVFVALGAIAPKYVDTVEKSLVANLLSKEVKEGSNIDNFISAMGGFTPRTDEMKALVEVSTTMGDVFKVIHDINLVPTIEASGAGHSSIFNVASNLLLIRPLISGIASLGSSSGKQAHKIEKLLANDPTKGLKTLRDIMLSMGDGQKQIVETYIKEAMSKGGSRRWLNRAVLPSQTILEIREDD